MINFEGIKALLDVVMWKDQDCHPDIPRGKEFHMLQGAGAVSIEEALCLYGLVLVTRPDVVIELGTSRGASTLFLGAAVHDLSNPIPAQTVDLGEVAPRECVTSAKLLRFPIEFNTGKHSMDYLKEYVVDPSKRYFVFSDTKIPVRPDEVRKVFEKFPSTTIVVVHDTSEHHPAGPMKLEEKLSDLDLNFIELPSPRGLTIVTKRQNG